MAKRDSHKIGNATLHISRYEHGGGRMWLERAGQSRDLVADLYDDEPGARRDALIEVIVRALDDLEREPK